MDIRNRRYVRWLFLIFILAGQAVILPGCGDDDEGSNRILSSGGEETYVVSQRQTILTMTNEARASAGVAPLAMDPALNEVAQAHAVDMAVRDFFSHVNPDGESPFDRLVAAGIDFSWAGENIAWYPSAESAVVGWINSPGHYANMVNANFRKIGIGVYKLDPESAGNFYYVQVFTD